MPERALQDVYRMFDRLGIYEELLEKPLLKHTEMFYQEEASNAVASMQLPEYLSLVTKRLTDERRRSTHYVPPSTFAVLEGVVYRVMVTAHLDFLLGPELSAALDKEDTPTLARVLSLLQDTDATLRLKEAVEKFVQVRSKPPPRPAVPRDRIESDIARLEHRRNTTSMSLAEEKKLLKDIDL